ncbi:catalase [Allopusillimonas ginsengisoli]|uniref:catalase n=1 Tax=Allopusillimonas ginsengisoli TaxID=453575 RepID=UPI00101EA827|nr:catalase [Allopusillimonas ginsengisoli]TEA78931.1 catalase [Allopusillimonas ginsengisoli]
MATSKNGTPRRNARQTSVDSAFTNTDSGPALPPNPDSKHPSVNKAAEVGAMAAAMPHNPTKKSEYGHDNALSPPQGAKVEPPSEQTTGSTLSETNDSDKVGGPAVTGENAAGGSLGRVRADAGGQALTTNQGVKVSDNQNSLKAGLRGPALLKDFILREKITHFDHERIPERVVHARGSAAHGYFECYKPLSSLTQASLFSEKGKITPVFVRFSTVAGERGSKDTARDVRGFAVKFYTDEGNWDLVGNNMPVFFIQDAMKFPDLVHAVKPEPHHGMPQAASAHDTFWDFVSLMPESTHMLMWLMSDRAIPRSFRMMQGFGVHTFRFVNKDGESTFVKFHWNPTQGTHSLVWDEAVKIAGADPDFNRRDLWESIDAGEYPEWELGIQTFSEEEAERFSFDVLDSTKLIPEELVPVQPIGRMVLNRNPDNFFAETEQVAFCSAHVVPGVDFSNDPLLAGRIHSYIDTQITRLGGPNFHELPINAPLAPVHNNQRDGMHRQAIHRGRVSYEPNSLAGGCPFQAGTAGFVSFPEPVEQDEVRGKPEKFAEHYAQAKLFYDSQTEIEQKHIANAYRFELSKVTVPAIRERTVSMLRNVSESLAADIAQGLGMPLPEPMPLALADPQAPEITASPSLSLTARPGSVGIRTRKVAILVADGVDGDQVRGAAQALQDEGAVVRLVGPRIGPFKASDGSLIDADASLENQPAVLFDGFLAPDGATAADAPAVDGLAKEFAQDQYRHCKTILVSGTASALLEAAGIPADEPDAGLIVVPKLDKQRITQFIDALAKHRHFERETDPPMV